MALTESVKAAIALPDASMIPQAFEFSRIYIMKLASPAFVVLWSLLLASGSLHAAAHASQQSQSDPFDIAKAPTRTLSDATNGQINSSPPPPWANNPCIWDVNKGLIPNPKFNPPPFCPNAASGRITSPALSPSIERFSTGPSSSGSSTGGSSSVNSSALNAAGQSAGQGAGKGAGEGAGEGAGQGAGQGAAQAAAQSVEAGQRQTPSSPTPSPSSSPSPKPSPSPTPVSGGTTTPTDATDATTSSSAHPATTTSSPSSGSQAAAAKGQSQNLMGPPAPQVIAQQGSGASGQPAEAAGSGGVKCIQRSGCKPSAGVYGSPDNRNAYVGLLAPAGQCQVSGCMAFAFKMLSRFANDD